MLASLGTVAFAAEDTGATGVVKDWQNANALDITSVTSTKSTVDGVTNYTVTVNYTGVADGSQVTVLGYIYDDSDAELTAVPAEDAIYAVNQEEKSGSTVIKLSSAGEKAVKGNEVLVIKMGSDSEGITAAQAVTVNLASATEQKADLVVNADPASVNATVDYGDGKTALMGQLPDSVTVTGTRDGEQDNTGASVNVLWNVAEDWTANNLNGMTVTGTLQETTGVVLGSHTTVTANVTVNPLTTADVVAPAAIEVAKDGGAAAVAAKVGKVTVKSGDITDTYTIDAADVTVDTTAEGTVDATIVIEGESDNKIFNLTDKSTTVSVTVTEKPAGPTGIYGNISDDFDTNEVNDFDWMALLNHVTGRVEIDAIKDKSSAEFKAANVNNDFDTDEVNDFDWMALLNHVTGRVTNELIGTEF
ncbi:MAG: hypothetical protein U0L92_05775 [Clostridia bacterium]|nr:hypothetical protein [Clostridia bacterium]